MKVVAKPIQMIAWYCEDETPNPVRFRIKNKDESYQTIKVDKIINRDIEKLAGNLRHVFTCSSIVNGVEKIFELKYELLTCKWILFKI